MQASALATSVPPTAPLGPPHAAKNGLGEPPEGGVRRVRAQMRPVSDVGAPRCCAGLRSRGRTCRPAPRQQRAQVIGVEP